MRHNLFSCSELVVIALICALATGVILSAKGCARKEPTTTEYSYDLSPIKGVRISDLYCMYLGGTCGVVPATLSASPAKKLEQMWGYKLGLAPGNLEVRNTAHTLLREYRENAPQRMNLGEYRRNIETLISLTWAKLDWDEFAQIKRVYYFQFDLVRDIARRVGERELLAYALTELMPSDHGKLNVKILDLLLVNDGREFVEAIPALGDRLVSFGPFQFTSISIHHTPDSISEVCRVSNALPKALRPPESVALMRGDDHYRAAYCLTLANVANLASSLSDRQSAILTRMWRSHWIDMVQYIAVAHHAPTAARRFAREWLNDSCRKPYAEYCTGRYQKYATKAAANFRALNR